jgi:hypothetical protein
MVGVIYGFGRKHPMQACEYLGRPSIGQLRTRNLLAPSHAGVKHHRIGRSTGPNGFQLSESL